jgi:hypothetical protein
VRPLSFLLRLAVNRLAEKGTWDLEELKAELMSWSLKMRRLSCPDLGRTKLIISLSATMGNPQRRAPLEPVLGRPAASRVGDVFQLGPHRLICGDSGDSEVVACLMQSDTARMIFTDEPFNVAIGGHVTGGEHREFVMASGEMTDAQFLEFNRRWIGRGAFIDRRRRI